MIYILRSVAGSAAVHLTARVGKSSFARRVVGSGVRKGSLVSRIARLGVASVKVRWREQCVQGVLALPEVLPIVSCIKIIKAVNHAYIHATKQTNPFSQELAAKPGKKFLAGV